MHHHGTGTTRRQVSDAGKTVRQRTEYRLHTQCTQCFVGVKLTDVPKLLATAINSDGSMVGTSNLVVLSATTASMSACAFVIGVSIPSMET